MALLGSELQDTSTVQMSMHGWYGARDSNLCFACHRSPAARMLLWSTRPTSCTAEVYKGHAK